LSAAYTYTNAKDRMSMDFGVAEGNAGSTPVNGTLEHRELRTSYWETPHKVTLVARTDLPLGLRFGLTYVGMSGPPYTYVLAGDPNADGFRPDRNTSNDVLYVPRNGDDIALEEGAGFATLDSLIRSERCLRNQRGRLLKRNSCRDPWVHETAARLSKTVALGGRRTLEVTADLFNLLNFVDRDWGLVRRTGSDTGNLVPLMDLASWDAVHGRAVYVLNPVYPAQIDVEASRWRLQLGSRLSF
jgi:hypothetical protein